MQLVLFAALWGCAGSLGGVLAPPEADSDRDGILDVEEAGFGTTVGAPDTDHDGLRDGEELFYGTHPLIADSDGDGYRDGDEIDEGSDPWDAEDGIYAGGWPFQARKDHLDSVDLPDASTEMGSPFARLRLLDQYGEEVDLYDFAGHRKPALVMVGVHDGYGTTHEVSGWLEGPGSASWLDPYAAAREWVDAGEMYFVLILATDTVDEDGTAPEPEDARAWAQMYPDLRAPVLVGDPSISEAYGFPAQSAMFFLDPGLRIAAGDGSIASALEAAAAYQPSEAP